MELHSPDGSSLTTEVEDNKDGTYTASFTPDSKGDHQITVHIRGKPIQGNPFDLQVTSGIDCDKIGPMMFKFTSCDQQSKTTDETCEPWGVAVDPEGRVVVTDHHNHRLQVSGWKQTNKWMNEWIKKEMNKECKLKAEPRTMETQKKRCILRSARLLLYK